MWLASAEGRWEKEQEEASSAEKDEMDRRPEGRAKRGTRWLEAWYYAPRLRIGALGGGEDTQLGEAHRLCGGGRNRTRRGGGRRSRRNKDRFFHTTDSARLYVLNPMLYYVAVVASLSSACLHAVEVLDEALAVGAGTTGLCSDGKKWEVWRLEREERRMTVVETTASSCRRIAARGASGSI